MRGMTRTRFRAADYSFAANPALAKENSPWPVFALLILGIVAVSAMWFFARGPVRVTRPRVRVEGTRVIVSSAAANSTSQPVHLSVRIVIGSFSPPRSKASVASFREFDHRDMELYLEPRSTRAFECDFAVPNGNPYADLQAEVQVLRRE